MANQTTTSDAYDLTITLTGSLSAGAPAGTIIATLSLNGATPALGAPSYALSGRDAGMVKVVGNNLALKEAAPAGSADLKFTVDAVLNKSSIASASAAVPVSPASTASADAAAAKTATDRAAETATKATQEKAAEDAAKQAAEKAATEAAAKATAEKADADAAAKHAAEQAAKVAAEKATADAAAKAAAEMAATGPPTS